MNNAREGVLVALFELVSRAKRRYGGYIVHLGLVAMYFGFTGAAYDKDKETALHPGEAFEVSGVTVRYDQSRMEVDPNKRMIFTDMTVLEGGKEVAHISPAKFIYEKPQGTATTEVAIRSTLAKDVYAIMNSVNPETKVATFRVIVRPFVAWIWLGGLLMIFGTFVCMSPSVREVLGESRERSRIPAGAAAAMSAIVLAVLTGAMLFALLSPSFAHAQNDYELAARRLGHDAQRYRAPAVLALALRVRRLPAPAAVELRMQRGRGDARQDPRGPRCRQDRRCRSRKITASASARRRSRSRTTPASTARCGCCRSRASRSWRCSCSGSAGAGRARSNSRRSAAAAARPRTPATATRTRSIASSSAWTTEPEPPAMASVLPIFFVIAAGLVPVARVARAVAELAPALDRPSGRAARRRAARPKREGLLREKQELLTAIRDVRFEHELGKVSDADFERLEQRYRARARDVLRELDEQIAPYRDEARALLQRAIGGAGAQSPDEDARARAGAARGERRGVRAVRRRQRQRRAVLQEVRRAPAQRGDGMKRAALAGLCCVALLAPGVAFAQDAPRGPADVIGGARKARDARDLEQAGQRGMQGATPPTPRKHPPTPRRRTRRRRIMPRSKTPRRARRSRPRTRTRRCPTARCACAWSIPPARPCPTPTVSIGIMSADSKRTSQDGRTGADGYATFAGMPVGEKQAYRVNVPYQGAKYSSTPFRLPPRGGYEVQIRRLPVTHDERMVVLYVGATSIELKDDRLKIVQQVQLLNLGSATYVFPEAGTLVRLPKGFMAVQTQDSMTDQHVSEAPGEGVRVKGSLPPGDATILWGFDLPITGTEASFTAEIPWLTFAYRVISDAPPGMTLQVDGMPEPIVHSDAGRHFLVTELQRKVGDTPFPSLHVTLRGMPGSGSGPLDRRAARGRRDRRRRVRHARQARATARRRTTDGFAALKAEVIARARALAEQREAGEIGPEYHAEQLAELETELAALLYEQAQQKRTAKSPASAR